MPVRLQKELEKIKKQILSLGALVEERVHAIDKIIENIDIFDANQIIKRDYEIDDMEIEVEEECLKILALHQPVAADLRFLVSTIKINNDLERIADESVNIARRVIIIAKRKEGIEFKYDYKEMIQKVVNMLRTSLDSLVNLDTDAAYKVCLLDDEVDEIHRDAYDRIKAAMREHPDHIGYLLNMFQISRHLERIGDHSTNIAEEVVYMIEGEIVRHSKEIGG